MAPSIIYNNTTLRVTFLPDEIFVFGSFALRANSIGHLEQIGSYAPGHQIIFGNLNYVADIQGDLIFQGFATPTSALALDPEHIARSEDGPLEPAGLSAATRPSMGEPEEVVSLATIRKPESTPDTSSEPLESALRAITPASRSSGAKYPLYKKK